LQTLSGVSVQPQTAAASTAALTGTQFTPTLNNSDDDQDDDGEEIDPSAIFGSTPPSFSPNVGATAAPLVASQPAPGAASPTHVGAELDPRGYPWDGRIHSSSKARVAKGNTWKYIRGIDKGVVEAVEAELRAQGFGSVTGHAEAAPISHTPVVAPAPVTTAVAPTLPGLPGLPPKPTGPTADSIRERFTRALQTQLPGIDAPWILQLLGHFQVPDLQKLSDHPDTWPAINAHLDSIRDSAPEYKDL
jgi:hypothetical protein